MDGNLFSTYGRDEADRRADGGGVVTSTILELIIYPAIYMIWRGREFRENEARREEPPLSSSWTPKGLSSSGEGIRRDDIQDYESLLF